MSEAVKVNADQKVVLTLADLQEVLNYVSTRPYAEVFKVVEALKKAKTFESVANELAQQAFNAAAAANEAAIREVNEEAPVASEA